MTVRLVSLTQPHPWYLAHILGLDRPQSVEEEIELMRNKTPEDILVHIARVSSGREDTFEDPMPLIRYLIANQHWSPFEHTMITFEITTSLAIATQYLRHRSFTFQQFSQRYARVSEFEPVEIRQQAEKNRQSSTDVFDPIIHEGKATSEDFMASDLIKQTIDECFDTYNTLLDKGVAKEVARMVLPQTTQTKLYMSGTLRSWIHLIGLREDSHAQKEAQEIAMGIKNMLMHSFPLTSEALGWTR